MKRILLIILILIIGTLILYSDSIIGSSKSSKAIKKFELRNFREGDKDSTLSLKLIGLEGSEISKNFLNHLASKIQSFNAEGNKIYLDVEILGGSDSREFKEIISEIAQAKQTMLLVLSPDVFLTQESKDEILKQKVNTFLFSNDSDVVCESGKLGTYIWNFGIPTEAYSETFLSFISQKFSKLAQELKIFVYANDKPKLKGEAELFTEEIRDLGLAVAGKVFVDDRQEDIYPILRQIYEYDPKVIIASVSRRGLHTFMPIAAKLGFTYEIALAFSNEVYEEDLIKLGDVSRGVLLPTAYVSDLNRNKNEEQMTASGYQGQLVAGIIEKLFFRGLKENLSHDEFAKTLSELDGVQYSGLSGLVSVDSRTKGLIQPLHIGEFKDNSLKHVQYLGDVSLAPEQVCKAKELVNVEPMPVDSD